MSASRPLLPTPRGEGARMADEGPAERGRPRFDRRTLRTETLRPAWPGLPPPHTGQCGSDRPSGQEPTPGPFSAAGAQRIGSARLGPIGSVIERDGPSAVGSAPDP